MMTPEEWKEKITSGEISAGSQMKLRDENIQKRSQGKRYQFLKKEADKIAKIIIPKELAFDFDPRTGSSEVFNISNKFRPMMAPTTLALVVKQLANECDETKKIIMRRSGLEEWDTSQPDTFTEQDKVAFKPYLYPQLFTFPVFKTTLKGMTTRPYGIEYLINIKRDPITNKIEGDAPFPIKAKRFYTSIANEKEMDYKEKIKSKKLLDDEETQKSTIKEFYSSSSKVTAEYPRNYARGFVIPLDINYSIEKKYALETITTEKLEDVATLIAFNAEITATIDKFRAGAWQSKDIYFDFYEFDMVCPTAISDPKELGKKTRFERPENPLKDSPHMEKFHDVYVNTINEMGDDEKIVWASTGLTEYNEVIEERLMEAIAITTDLDDEFITKKVITSNKDFILTVFGEEGSDLIMRAEEDVLDKAEGALNEENVELNTAKNFDIGAVLEDETLGLSEINMEGIA